MQKLTEIYKKSILDNWDNVAMSDYNSPVKYTYGEFAEKIDFLHTLFNEYSIQKGDKVAVLGKNSSHWLITFISAITSGAVIVPVLDEFSPKDVIHILGHCDAKIFLCDEWFLSKVNFQDIPSLKNVFSLKDFSEVYSSDANAKNNNIESVFKSKHPNGFSKESVSFVNLNPDDVVIINYTSGTTSFTKGVMLMEKNITSNIVFFMSHLADQTKRSLAILPIAHVYGLLFGALSNIACGGTVTFLARIPSPAVLLKACAEINPTLLTVVPLIFEKIYKLKIRPVLQKPHMKALCKIPFVKSIIYKNIGKKLYNQLGGKGLYQVIIGGAAINKDVEQFLRDIKFPFGAGYGMTECAPLISYSDYHDHVLQSVGKCIGLPHAEVRLGDINHESNLGEFQVRGDNVMKGYYKDEEGTRNTFTEDGWLKTGDLGVIDNNGNLFIKGRSKTMLLGPSGENIYTESIESKIVNMPFVSECIILQNKEHKLVAFVYPDYQMIEDAGISVDKLDRLMANNRRTINDELARFENIYRIEILEEPLPKTPKNTIKRYGLEHLIVLHETNKRKKLDKKREENAKILEETKAVKSKKTKSSKKTNKKKSSK